jgi:uracil-DNA glycosylase
MQTWETIHAEIFQTKTLINLRNFIKEERKTKTIVPLPAEVMNAFKLTPFDKVRVVILGQDPYPDKNHAHGLAFSSKSLVTPGSLKNIFLEIARDVYPGHSQGELFHTNDLTKWAQQGVLLLNTVLTCEQGKPGSHLDKGWETFTKHVLQELNAASWPIVFLLWGNAARTWKSIITNPRHHVFETSHPSPKSVDKGFSGCSHFSAVNTVIRDDYFDLRPFITFGKLITELQSFGKQKNVIFDPALIASMNIGMYVKDIPNKTVIDWTL